MIGKKTLLVTGATTIVGLASFAGVASAATTPTTGTDGSTTTQTLAGRIAAKFNLNKDDVQTVIDQDREDHQAERQQKLEARLTQAVKDGKITSAQKDQILAKLKDLHTYMESIKDKTASERRDLMKTKMDELRQWAKDNGLTAYMPMGPHKGGFGAPMHSDDSSSSSSNMTTQ